MSSWESSRVTHIIQEILIKIQNISHISYFNTLLPPRNTAYISFLLFDGPSLQICLLFIGLMRSLVNWEPADFLIQSTINQYCLINRFMSSTKISMIKRIGQSAKGEFQQLHLAVFPIEIQFLRKIDFSTVYYFEKDHQILGNNNEMLIKAPANDSGAKHQFLSEEYLVNFRIHSQKNVVYKWSVYKQHKSQQQQFLESCSFNLKEIVINFIQPIRSEPIKTTQSLISYSFNEKLFRCRFQRSGILIKFIIIVSNDPHKIRENIRKNYNEHTLHHLYNMPTIQFSSGAKQISEKIKDLFQNKETGNHPENSEDDFFLQSYSLLSDDGELKVKKKASNCFEKEESKESKSKHFLRDKSLYQDDSLKEIGQLKSKNISSEKPSLDLDQIILNDIGKKFNGQNSMNYIISGSKSEQQDLKFGIEIRPQKSAEAKDTNLKSISINYNKASDLLDLPFVKQKSRDYSVLRLQSDAVKQQQIDIKLQLEQDLQIIEEEKFSIKHQLMARTFESKDYQSRRLKVAASPVKEEKQQNVMYSNSKLKNILSFLLFLSIVILVTAAIIDSKHTKKTTKKPVRDH